MRPNYKYIDILRAEKFHIELKKRAGLAEFVAEEAIINELGAEALYQLKKHNLIECCGVLNGKKMYAI